MHPTKFNLTLMDSMLEEMESFLLSKELFWPLALRSSPGQIPYPRLSIGVFLLTEDELIAQKTNMDSEQAAEYSRLRLKRQGIFRKWKSAIQRKSLQELGMRRNLWRALVEEIEEKKRQKFDYKQDVRNRVMFQRLQDLVDPSMVDEDLIQGMQSIDTRYISQSQRAEFVWDPELKPLYGEDDYWFLYRIPRERQ